MDKTLAALVVHDIKNSLYLLEIDLEQLNHEPELSPHGRQAYVRCLELKNRLIEFLTIYKHEQSGLNPHLQNVVTMEFLEDIVANSQSVLAPENHHGHPIAVQVAYELSSIKHSYFRFDRNLLDMALESAINNAVRYAHKLVQIWVVETDEALSFFVKDDGNGVDTSKPLLSRKTNDKSASTGIGMALCQSVAEVHGGSVSLSDSIAGGALFQMTLART